MSMDKKLPLKMDRVEELDLLRLLSTIYANKYKIICTTLIFALLAFGLSSAKMPVYVASVLVQLEKNSSNNLIGKLMSPLEEEVTSASTEMGILKSRRVLNQTIDELGLQVVITEKQFPVIGQWLEAFSGPAKSAIDVNAFSVPPESEDLPWTLTILTPDSYQLDLGEAGSITGRINETVKKNGFAINVARIAASAGTEFNLVFRSKFTVLQDLLTRLNATELNKDSGLLSVSFTGSERQEIVDILNNITLNFIEDSRVRKAEETSKSLEFVNSLLPGVLEKLNQADRQLHDFKEENGSIDLPLEAKAALDAAVVIQSQQNELQLAKVEISKKYTKSHPIYRSLLEKEALLNKEKASLAQTISNMPKKQQEILSIKRDVESGQEIYMQLMAKQQELGIANASTVASIRIVDEAVSDPRPVGSKKSLMVVLGAFLGLIFSSGYCLMLHVFRNPIEDVEVIESYGVDVMASVPLSKWLIGKQRQVRKQQARHKNIWLAQEYPEDLAIEALRSLRTGLFLALKQAGGNTFLISGATPGAGKTFVSSNLASVIADAGKSILVIDADLRLGYIHELLGLKEGPGLSEILQGKAAFTQTVQSSLKPGLDIISRGAVSARSSELLMSEHFVQLLDWARSHYDYVIIDTPPILPITDAAIVAQHVALSLLVLRYKTNSVKELEMAINRFQMGGVKLDGVVFNGVEKGSPSSYEYSYYSIAP